MNPTQSYTPEQTTQVLQLYAAGVSLEDIALTLQKSTRSIISKLVRENVYRAPTQPTPRLRKSEMVEQICVALQLQPELLESIQKATHGAIMLLHNEICR